MQVTIVPAPRISRNRQARALAALFAALFVAHPSAGSEEQAAPARKMRLIPQWIPQAQFAGYYVALERGFYQKQGIDLEILAGGPDRSASDLLEKGEAEFATLWLTAGLRMRANGVPIVHLAQVSQQSALMLVARKSSGIRTIQDLNGKKISLWGADFEIRPKAFFKKNGLDVRLVSQSSTMNLFLRGGVDAASAMWYNEYHLLLMSGLEPDEITTFFYKDLGFDTPEDGLYCMEATWKSDPDLCARFAAASLEGWRYAFAQMDEALKIVAQRQSAAGVPVNRVHQRWMLQRMRDLTLPAKRGTRMGELIEADYLSTARMLVESGEIAEIPEFKLFHPTPKAGGPGDAAK